MWRHHRRVIDDLNLDERQKEAEAAVTKSLIDAATLEILRPVVEEKVGILERINRENNFAVKMWAAYRGEE